MLFEKSGNSANVGSLSFSKKSPEYSGLVALFADGTIDPATTPLQFYKDPKYKSTYGKFSFRSFATNWYFAKRESGMRVDEGVQRWKWVVLCKL